MTIASARRRYVTDAITTTSPAQLLVMLYDRLLLDLVRAGEALQRGDLATTNSCLLHAQDIVLELESSLDPTAWSGGRALAELYRFVCAELITANVTKDAARIATCHRLLTPLAEAWRAAAANPVDAAPVA
jgi:flagellar secretion chaperone FliS